MAQSRGPDEPPEDEDARGGMNLILLLVAVVVVVGGVWLVNKMVDMRKLQECAESGRHNCAPIEVPERDRP